MHEMVYFRVSAYKYELATNEFYVIILSSLNQYESYSHDDITNESSKTYTHTLTLMYQLRLLQQVTIS